MAGHGDQPVHEPFAHEPVMAPEVVEALRDVPTGLVVDGTLGGGGHARRLLEARPDLRLLGIDRDPDAVAASRLALAPFGDRVTVVHGGFEHLGTLVGTYRDDLRQTGTNDEPVVAVLFDLGVSSPQLDRSRRGFSYRVDAPLDMRMDPGQDLRAADVVNGYAEADLARILVVYGEERFARAIARAIVRRRPIASTLELAAVIKEAIPAAARRTGGHPATRSFQAIRIEVNAELQHLEEGLDEAFVLLGPGGRLAVLSYHSLEDRIVKLHFHTWASGPRPGPRGLPAPSDEPPARARLVGRGARRPGAAEVARNPRARSARLRVVEKLPEAP
jgi:16S rRNA (cytosine1402-N4)-methyltransferase